MIGPAAGRRRFFIAPEATAVAGGWLRGAAVFDGFVDFLAVVVDAGFFAEAGAFATGSGGATGRFAAMAGRAVSTGTDRAGADDAGAGVVVQALNRAAPIASNDAQRGGQIKKCGSFIRRREGRRQDNSHPDRALRDRFSRTSRTLNPLKLPMRTFGYPA
jgi:hypothetical protein